MLKNTDIENVAEALRMMVVGTVVSEYGMLKLKDQVYQDLKQRTNASIAASKKVQDWFRFNSSVSSKYEKIFTDEFNGDKLMLLSILVEKASKLNELGIETIIEAIDKSNQ